MGCTDIDKVVLGSIRCRNESEFCDGFHTHGFSGLICVTLTPEENVIPERDCTG